MRLFFILPICTGLFCVAQVSLLPEVPVSLAEALVSLTDAPVSLAEAPVSFTEDILVLPSSSAGGGGGGVVALLQKFTS